MSTAVSWLLMMSGRGFKTLWSVTKKLVPHQNWSPGPIMAAKTGPPCQFWSPVKTWIYNNLAMHGLPAHAAAGCSNCYCSYRPYTSYIHHARLI